MNKEIQLGGRVKLSNNNGFSLINSFFNRYTKKILAFTLAETLIVMGVIGIVAALTIPNLNSSTSNAEKVAKYKKIYAELNEAHNRAIAVYGPYDEWFNEDSCSTNSDCSDARIRYFNRITEFMKLQKNCGTTGSGCMPTNIIARWGSMNWTDPFDDTSYPRAVLAGGWSFCVWRMYKNYTDGSIFFGYSYNKSVGNLMVDIDGPNKGSSTFGIDIFHFIVTSDGVFPYGGGTLWTDDDIKHYCFHDADCGAWIINTGNMDYLDASHTSESDAGVCNKTNKQLSTTVTSCK